MKSNQIIFTLFFSKYCGQVVPEDLYVCMNSNCSVQSSGEMAQFETTFAVTVVLADHTGSLHNCHLIPCVTENLLKCSVSI